ADYADWRRDPSRTAIIVGTVYMIGSRLLFSGYGCSFRSKPLHAGLLGQDALLVHDEAHLEPAFQALITAIADEQHRSNEPRPLKVLALSATGRMEPDFTMGERDIQNPDVLKRFHARKGLQLHLVDDQKRLPELIDAKAAEVDGNVAIFISSVDYAEKCAQAQRKDRKDSVAVITGSLRGVEQDERDESKPVSARYHPRVDDLL